MILPRFAARWTLFTLLLPVAIAAGSLRLGAAGLQEAGGDSQAATEGDSATSTELTQVAWKLFRATHRFHTQVVALSGRAGDDTRVMIVAEPPPSVSLETIASLSPCIAASGTRQMAVGYDGWVRDVVLTLRHCPEDQVQTLVIGLHRLMFGTAYKAFSIPVYSEAASDAPADLNLHVTSAQLNRWLIGSTREKASTLSAATVFGLLLLTALFLVFAWILFRRRRFALLALLTMVCLPILFAAIPHRGTDSDAGVMRLKPVLGGTPTTLQTLLDGGGHGVYTTADPGLVVWCVGKDKTLDNAGVELREFAVDSDLLLGAIGRGDSVAIIGRTRSTSIARLPPLRAETMVQLASAHTGELAQSYERRFLFAGKTDRTDMGVAGPDWAPIYLSDQLQDTEYGSLLNITDQLLKSWSMHGLVHYANFPYPSPQTYPFERALLQEANTDEITFNWNTRGAGYVSTAGDFEVYSLSRLGSLPIDYLAQDDAQLRKAEDKAYAYYSGMSDPNLVRVVQYAGLYQIFNHFGITAMSAPPTHYPVNALKPETEALVDAFLAQPDDLSRYRGSESVLAKLREAHEQLKKFKEEASAEEYDTMISCLADPSAARLDASSETRSTHLIGDFCLHLSGSLQALPLLSDRALSNAGVRYEAQANKSSRARWIHTPTVVYSVATGPVSGTTGGHNLSAAVTGLEVDSTLAKGEVRVATADGRAVVYHSAADADEAPELARLAGRDADKSAEALQAELETSLRQQANDTRTIVETLHPGERAPEIGPAGMQLSQIPHGGQAAGWWNAPEAPGAETGRLVTAFAARKAESARPALIVTRGASFRYDIVGPRGLHVQADNLPSAVEAVRAATRETYTADGVHLHFVGIDETEGSGFAQSAEAQLPGKGTVEASFEGTMTPDDIRKLAADYDFAKVAVKDVGTPVVVDGKTVVDAHLEIASKSWFGKPLVVRIRLFFSDMASALSLVPQQLTAALHAISEQADIFTALSALKRDLKLAHPGLHDIQIQVIDSQRKDLYVAEDTGPAGCGRLAGQAA